MNTTLHVHLDITVAIDVKAYIQDWGIKDGYAITAGQIAKDFQERLLEAIAKNNSVKAVTNNLK